VRLPTDDVAVWSGVLATAGERVAAPHAPDLSLVVSHNARRVQ